MSAGQMIVLLIGIVLSLFGVLGNNGLFLLPGLVLVGFVLMRFARSRQQPTIAPVAGEEALQGTVQAVTKSQLAGGDADIQAIIKELANQSETGQRRGHWEYKEFTESLDRYTGGKKFWAAVIDWNLSVGVPAAEMRAPIAQGVQALLARITPEGWEPVESIVPDLLWAAGRVGWRYKNDFLDTFFGNTRSAQLLSVSLNCRRWVEH